MANTQLNIIIPTGEVDDVCPLQSVVTNGVLTQTGGNYINYMRNVSFTSVNDLSAVFFTIQGVQNGTSITENVFGPNNNTVYSTKYYSSITSIQASGSAAGVSVGSGNMSLVLYYASDSFPDSRFFNPYLTLGIDNPGGATDNVTTRVDGITNLPARQIDWEPDTLIATTLGTRSIKALDTTAQYSLIKENLQLYSGFAVTINGFPSQNVYVNIVQP